MPHQNPVRNIQSKLDDLIAEEDCLENLSDENEEL